MIGIDGNEKQCVIFAHSCFSINKGDTRALLKQVSQIFHFKIQKLKETLNILYRQLGELEQSIAEIQD